jgi:hypothetical protein
MKRFLTAAALLSLVLGTAGSAQAGGVDVSVGYADGLRGPGFFPSPWQGDAGVIFQGFSQGNAYDAGAIRIDNNTALPVAITGINVNLHPATQNNQFALWSDTVLAPGQHLILTQTSDYNFDTSDFPISPVGVPVVGGPDSPLVNFMIDGVPVSLADTGHVLDTEGFDYAAIGNESFAWRPIGGASGPSGVPEPASLVLFGVGGAGMALYRWRRRVAK